MNQDPDHLRLSDARRRAYRFGFEPRTFAGRAVGFVLGAVTLVLAFAFSIVVFAILTAGAVVAGGWLWWKTRHVRKQLRTAQAGIRPGEREVRGEAVVVREDAESDASRTSRQP